VSVLFKHNCYNEMILCQWNYNVSNVLVHNILENPMAMTIRPSKRKINIAKFISMIKICKIALFTDTQNILKVW